MKKLILFAFVSVAVTMVSCRKDVTCTCTGESTSVSSSGTYASTNKTSSTSKNVSRKNAKFYEDCDNRTEVNTYTSTSGSITSTQVNTTVYTCELK